MIKKLKAKFILINMICISVILAVVLSFIFISNYRQATRNTENYLLNESMRANKDNNSRGPMVGKVDAPPDSDIFNEKRMNILPSFSLKVDSSGELVDTSEHELAVDEETAAYLKEYALTTPLTGKIGSIKEYGLKYAVNSNSEDGYTYIVFCNTDFESSLIRTMLLTCICIFIVAFLAFLILSMFLSGWALAPVKKAWQQQNQFVADASHELRTPITVILANLDILSSHKEDTISEQYKWVNSTKDEAEHMKQLVEDLLFLAKSDASTTSVVMSTVDYSDCIIGRLLNFESIAWEKHITIDSDAVSGHLSINGNEGQIKQLITILLDNACKYAGEQGHITVSAFKEGDMAVLKVHNTGASIPEEEQAHIFERFYRTDKSRTRTEGGYGLGLSIADNIVKQHHGRIAVSSDAVNGTTFTVSLPSM